MSDDDTSKSRSGRLTLAGPAARLELRRPIETGQVRQSFPHGRSKTVTVEVRKKRAIAPGAAPEAGRAEPRADGRARAAGRAATGRRPSRRAGRSCCRAR